MKTEELVQRFLHYAAFDTQSDEDNDQVCPSTPGQMVFAKALADELDKMGLTEIELDDNGYLMATLPANKVKDGPTVGFISHLDTSPDAPGQDVHPQIVRHYDGGDVVLNAEKGIVFKTDTFPEVKKYAGQDIIFTDGTTLLGADDKAGVAAIVTAMHELICHPEIPHGKIRVAFTPDEETGRSPLRFDVARFGADFAYTVDGGEIGGLEYENFNADNPVVTFRGQSVHTGDAKGKMVNALSLAAQWQMMLPAGEKPEYTEGREGFFHVYKMAGDVETCTMHMLIRDHDRARYERRKQHLDQMADFFNHQYGAGRVRVVHHDVYQNMRDIIADGHMNIVELAKAGMEAAGVTPVVSPIRGGTDGAQLSFRGLPCPNLFTGGANFHGRFEYLPVPSLEKACQTVIEIAKRADQLNQER